MFKVNKKDTRTTSLTFIDFIGAIDVFGVVLMSLLLSLNMFHTLF